MLLQWGHGKFAVDDTSACWPATAVSGLLQWGHGKFAVDDPRRQVTPHERTAGFNGATANSPWMTTGRGETIQGTFGGFNGATANSPWMTPSWQLASPSTDPLQWGHGKFAVEDTSRRSRTAG